MANINGLAKGELPANASKSGEYYDNCINPDCGQRDVERKWKLGGRSNATGEEYLDFSIYGCDPNAGGCGVSWARTTPQRLAFDHAHGINTKWPTRSAAVKATMSLPSRRYQENYDQIDWSR